MTPERFLVWGAGGHARVVADLVRACGHHVAAFVDREAARFHDGLDGVGVLEEGRFVEELRAGRGLPEGIGALALGVGDNRARAECLRLAEGLPLPALVHPRAVVSPSVRVGRGVVVFANAVVNGGAVLEAAVIVNTAAVVEHDCVLREGAHLSPGAVLAGGVTVGRGSWVGAGAVVIQRVDVGDGSVVGAGAVVIRRVPGGVTVVGNPARILHASAAGATPRDEADGTAASEGP